MEYSIVQHNILVILDIGTSALIVLCKEMLRFEKAFLYFVSMKNVSYAMTHLHYIYSFGRLKKIIIFSCAISSLIYVIAVLSCGFWCVLRSRPPR